MKPPLSNTWLKNYGNKQKGSQGQQNQPPSKCQNLGIGQAFMALEGWPNIHGVFFVKIYHSAVLQLIQLIVSGTEHF